MTKGTYNRFQWLITVQLLLTLPLPTSLQSDSTTSGQTQFTNNPLKWTHITILFNSTVLLSKYTKITLPGSIITSRTRNSTWATKSILKSKCMLIHRHSTTSISSTCSQPIYSQTDGRLMKVTTHSLQKYKNLMTLRWLTLIPRNRNPGFRTNLTTQQHCLV